MTRYGRPINLFTRPGFLGRLGRYIPAPVKAFGVVATLAAATIVLAPVFIILAGPPLLVGALWWRRKMRMLQNMANQFHNQRWQDLSSFNFPGSTIQYSSNAPISKLPIFAKIIIENAALNNQHHLADILGVRDISDLSYGPLDSFSQDARLDSRGFTEKMSISEYPVLVNNRKRGIVRVITRGAAKEGEPSKSRIEVQSGDRIVVLTRENDSDQIIEGKGRPLSG